MTVTQSEIEQGHAKSAHHLPAASALFCALGGVVSIGAGIYLASLNAETGNSLIEAIANGIGWYCIGKGLFMLASTFHAQGLARYLFRGQD